MTTLFVYFSQSPLISVVIQCFSKNVLIATGVSSCYRILFECEISLICVIGYTVL